MALCREIALYKLKDIAKEMRRITYLTVSIILHRAKESKDFHKHLRQLKDKITKGEKKAGNR